jgi:uncharacterized membrane protein
MAIFIILIALVIYFLPSMAGYNKRNVGAIFALNLLLGWTLIGWVVAFVWAMTEDDEPKKVIMPQASKDVQKMEALKKLKDLYDSGALTEDEFKTEKSKILGNHIIKPGQSVQL